MQSQHWLPKVEGDKPIVWKSATEYLQTMGRHVSNVSIEEYGGARPKVKHPADGKKKPIDFTSFPLTTL